MRNKAYLLALPLLLALHGCTSFNCIKGNGAATRRLLEVADFKGLAAEGSLEVRLKQGAVQQVEVEAPSNLIDLLTTEVKDGIWHIATEGCYSTREPFVVHITVPSIDHVSVLGSGNIVGTDVFLTNDLTVTVQGSGELNLAVQAATVQATVQGSGDITLSGRCSTFKAYVQGSGNIQGTSLESETANAVVAGSGDISVNTTQDLDATVQGSGDIHYKGRPVNVAKNIQGSGDVKSIP